MLAKSISHIQSPDRIDLNGAEVVVDRGLFTIPLTEAVLSKCGNLIGTVTRGNRGFPFKIVSHIEHVIRQKQQQQQQQQQEEEEEQEEQEQEEQEDKTSLKGR